MNNLNVTVDECKVHPNVSDTQNGHRKRVASDSDMSLQTGIPKKDKIQTG